MNGPSPWARVRTGVRQWGYVHRVRPCCNRGTTEGHKIVRNPWVCQLHSGFACSRSASPIYRKAPIDLTNLYGCSTRKPVGFILTIILILHLLPEPPLRGVR